MDLKQNKLTRSEWDSIEIPVSAQEREILQLIMDGYSNINIKVNKTTSMMSFLKIEPSSEMDLYLFQKYFAAIIQKTLQKYSKAAGFAYPDVESSTSGLKKIRSIDSLRIENLDANIKQSRESIYEYVLLDLCNYLCKYLGKERNKYALYLYTIVQLRKATIANINIHVLDYVNELVQFAMKQTDLTSIISRAYEFIEKNPTLLEYADKELFSHQKELFNVFASDAKPKLVLYVAPTGTGKTLSPLGLSSNYRIIFVCVARHIGLALAKSAISAKKRIAFAFGCETASDIRLHYYSAVKFTKDKRSGAIKKIDNEYGERVEIMICDVQSYLTAMHYMLAFNPAYKMITYWDEPTITLDYADHELHPVIHRNWCENLIPNMVLSCATLPKESEIVPVLMDFRERFDGAATHTIASYDCRKSIPMMTKDGFCAMPHTMYSDHRDLRECVQACEDNKTLLRYFDLNEIVKFVFYLQEHLPDDLRICAYFAEIGDITMNSLKLYYLELLKRVDSELWPTVYAHFCGLRKSKFMKKPVASATPRSNSTSVLDGITNGKIMRTVSMDSARISEPSNGLMATTEDAYTLTDGPTIFLCDDVTKIGNFYIQQSKIPGEAFQLLLKKIAKNSELSAEIGRLERTLEDMENKSSGSSESNHDIKDSKKDLEKNPEIFKFYQQIEALRKQVKFIALDAEYVPNTKPHQKKWAPTPTNGDEYYKDAFVPQIDETTTRDIMSLDIDNYLKVLLLLGIGLFYESDNASHAKYLELMKTLAIQQDLFMIIASSDYVYGTNYNFCHGFLGKDLTNMTREKTLQCMGRIGRGQIQQTYTIRFRDDEMIYGLFREPTVHMEAENMCRLFTA